MDRNEKRAEDDDKKGEILDSVRVQDCEYSLASHNARPKLDKRSFLC